MGRPDTIKLLLIVFVAIICLVALATKAHHWDSVVWKGSAKDNWNEVYPGLEGCIAIDAIILIFMIVGVVFSLVSSLKKYMKYLVILIAICLIIANHFSPIVLGWEQGSCRKTIDDCESNDNQYCYNANYGNGYTRICIDNPFCVSDYYKSLKGAWGVRDCCLHHCQHLRVDRSLAYVLTGQIRGRKTNILRWRDPLYFRSDKKTFEIMNEKFHRFFFSF